MPVIVTWNVNSLRQRMDAVLDWLKQHSPDVVLLQETKVVNEAFPREPLEDAGYNVVFHGQKTFNGVAILSKGPLEEVKTALPGDEMDVQARFIEALTTLDGQVYRVASIYVPNGGDVGSDKFAYKLAFFDRLYAYASNVLRNEEPVILGGDYNNAPYPPDVYDPIRLDGTTCYHAAERIRLRALHHLGFGDAYRLLHAQEHAYSWWDYRGGSWPRNQGLRIDHLLLSPEAQDKLIEAGMDMQPRGAEKASDHIPVWCKLNAA